MSDNRGRPFNSGGSIMLVQVYVVLYVSKQRKERPRSIN